MTQPSTPKPAECWGLYDAGGKLRRVFFRMPFPDKVSSWRRVGWTIRRVTVTPLPDKNGGEG